MGSNKLRLNSGPVLAALLTVLLLLWMVSGLLAEQPATPETPAHVHRDATRVTVQIHRQQATIREQAVLMQGQTEPGRKASLRAELDGVIAARNVRKGSLLKQGDLLLRIDVGDLPQQRERALALIRQRELEFEGARKMRKQGHLAEAQLAERTTQLAAARAELASIEEQLNGAVVQAPFPGRLDQLPAELGDYVRKGDLLAAILDFDPWIVAGDVTEQEAPLLRVGGPAEISLTTGQTASGHIRFIAHEGNSRTRTFRVEVEISDSEIAPIAGMTAGARLPVAQVTAHRISPALLTLDQAGRLGVRIVVDGNRVAFRSVQMIEAGPDGIWITGLPERADIITVGAGYVQEGDLVDVVTEPDDAAAAPAAGRDHSE